MSDDEKLWEACLKRASVDADLHPLDVLDGIRNAGFICDVDHLAAWRYGYAHSSRAPYFIPNPDAQK